jgi:hypothetical protein
MSDGNAAGTELGIAFEDLLERAQGYSREKAVAALAHCIVVAISGRREKLADAQRDCERLGEQMKQLVEWNFTNIQRYCEGEPLLYFFFDPAQNPQQSRELNEETYGKMQ